MHHFLQYSMARAIQESRRNEADRIALARRMKQHERASDEPGPSAVDALIEVILTEELAAHDRPIAPIAPPLDRNAPTLKRSA
jgi:hypothetical protein